MEGKSLVSERLSFSSKSAITRPYKVATKVTTILYISSGQAEVLLGGRSYSASSGSVFLLLKGDYCVVYPKNAVIVTTGIDEDILSARTQKLIYLIENKAVSLNEDAFIRVTDLTQAISHYFNYNDEVYYLASDSAFYCMLAEVFNGSALNEKLDDTPIAKAHLYIEENFLKCKKLVEVADYSGVTVNYLCALFKTKTGHSPNRYFKILKIRLAMKTLLETERQAKEVAEICGYLSFSHFMSDFKEETGMTPLNFKKKYS